MKQMVYNPRAVAPSSPARAQRVSMLSRLKLRRSRRTSPPKVMPQVQGKIIAPAVLGYFSAFSVPFSFPFASTGSSLARLISDLVLSIPSHPDGTNPQPADLGVAVVPSEEKKAEEAA